MDSTIDSSLLDHSLSSFTKSAIAEAFWGSHHLQSFRAVDTNFDCFWAYYSKKCNHALHDGGRHVAARTHRDIIDVVRQLKLGANWADIRRSLRPKLTIPHANEEELLENSIDLAANLLLMCDCGSFSHGFSGRMELKWREGPLGEFLTNYFGEEPVLDSDRVKLDKNFIARNIVRIGGVQIIWTDNLLDHLRLTDDDKRVHIFHHASFLEHQRQSLLPEGLAAETLQTLALLFPSTNRETRKWVSRLPALDQRVTRCGRLKTELRRIEKFRFWRDRLVMLKQVFDEAQPNTLTQWWYDRRNGVQWYTFWVAVLVLVLTILFGLVQSIEGALQVYVAFKALHGPS
ncbi:hypothetical protein DL771_010201 [Monosporascus sp. 5C6A]|nr:hypothetical protein DL771_010201 [Monosporascus sp. 5C6A]